MLINYSLLSSNKVQILGNRFSTIRDPKNKGDKV